MASPTSFILPRPLVAALIVVMSVWWPATVADVAVVARNYAVIAGHPEATRLGIQVLEDGGSAADALVTVSLALGVVEPGNSGLGGKLIVLYYDARSGEVSTLAGMEAAPGMDQEKLARLDAEARRKGYKSTCIPGLPAALGAAHEKWGSKPWKNLVLPAAGLAEQGFEVNKLCAEMFGDYNSIGDAVADRIYLPGGKTPQAGDTFKNPDLAKTLRIIAEQGAGAFYSGEIAEKIVAAQNAAGWKTTLDDFKNYKPRFLPPLSGQYRSCTVFTAPPPLTGGATVLAGLKVLEQMDFPAGCKPRDAKYIDTLSRALQQIYSPVARVAGDAPESRQNVEKILEPQSIKSLADKAMKADPGQPFAAMLPARPFFEEPMLDDGELACTTHLIVIDKQGNIACATQSLGLHFGACVVPEGTGILMGNGMNNFAYATRSSVNFVGPGKWSRSTIAPTIVMKNDKPFLVLGAPGGQRIPTAVFQAVVDVVDFNRPLRETVEGARFHLRRPTSSGQAPNIVDLDELADEKLPAQLRALGWTTSIRKFGEFYFGPINAAVFQPDGTILGVADQRRTGDADGNE